MVIAPHTAVKPNEEGLFVDNEHTTSYENETRRVFKGEISFINESQTIEDM